MSEQTPETCEEIMDPAAIAELAQDARLTPEEADFIMKYAGTYSIDKSFDVDNWKPLDADGSQHFPFQHRMQITTQDGKLVANFRGALAAGGEINRTAELTIESDTKWEFKFPHSSRHVKSVDFVAEITGYEVRGNKKTFLMTMFLESTRAIVRAQ